MAQLLPSASSLGTVEGKVSDKEDVVTVDIFNKAEDTDHDRGFQQSKVLGFSKERI
jgi:hypothetical protein